MGLFRLVRAGEKRGGAGTRSEMGGSDSGNRGAAGSIKVRTTSEEDKAEDCRDLWWSSIHLASRASDVSWIHWSMRAAISWRRLAAWLRRVSSKLCNEAREAACR